MSMMHPHRKYGEVANTNLGTLDTSVLVNLVIGYTPPTRLAREIMMKVAFDNFEDGIQPLAWCFSQCISRRGLCLSRQLAVAADDRKKNPIYFPSQRQDRL